MSTEVTLDESSLNPQALADQTAPPGGHLAVTPSDVNMLYPPLREIRVGAAGDVKLRLAGSANEVVYKDCYVGEYISGRIAQVLSTGTTATDIVGRW